MYRDFVTGKMVAEPDDPPALDDEAIGCLVMRRVCAFRQGARSVFADAQEASVWAGELEALAVAYGTELIRAGWWRLADPPAALFEHPDDALVARRGHKEASRG